MSRVDRVQEEIRHQIGLILQRDINDPSIGFVTITGVDVSPDLKQADVYFTTLAKDESFEETMNGLRRAEGFVRKLIGKRIRIKFTPDIHFIYDDSGKTDSRIDEIIERIHKEEGR